MKKILLTVILVLSVLGCAFAQSIDYRQVIFGNNYEQIHEIDADAFFSKYPQVKNVYTLPPNANFKKMVNWVNKYEIVYSTMNTAYTRIYQQQVGEIIFYRVLVSYEKLTDSMIVDWKKRYIEQYVFMKEADKKLCYIGEYYFGDNEITQWSNNPKYNGLEIIQRENTVKGILAYSLRYNTRGSSECIYNDAKYYLYQVITEYKTAENESLDIVDFSLTSKVPSIKIEASRPLIDSRRPFMYTIQNAFDGNPATSYVEDTENDLMNVSVSLYDYGNPTRISVINGYAQSETTYKNNNRIKEISDISISVFGTKTEYSKDRIIFEDNKIDLQISNWWGGGFFTVTDIYKGSKYTDTCLAELDFYTEEYGWLFGGLDE